MDEINKIKKEIEMRDKREKEDRKLYYESHISSLAAVLRITYTGTGWMHRPITLLQNNPRRTSW